MNDPRLAIIESNLEQVRERIARAAERAGRSPDDVLLVAVTKYVDEDVTRLLIEAGCHALGESRPQSLWQKWETLSDPSIAWHMIGHLQRNKVRRTVGKLSWIHSLDSERLMSEIQKELEREETSLKGMLEINISGDPSKTGLLPEDAWNLLSKQSAFPRIQIEGLMAMASLKGDLDVARRDFAALRTLRDEWRERLGQPEALSELSMGMSRDYEQAIAEGSTMIRVGSALFNGLNR